MAGYGFEWAGICLDRVTAAAGLRARFGETSYGAPYARLTLDDDAPSLATTLQVAEDTLIVTTEVATDRDEPTDAELARLDEVALRWPCGSLAWDRQTRTLLARAHLDAPEGRAPSAGDLRAVLNALLAAAPELARLEVPRVFMGDPPLLADVARAFERSGLTLVPVADGVLGQRVRRRSPEIGSLGVAIGIDVEHLGSYALAAGFWMEGELLDGTSWPAGRSGALLLNELRNAIGPGTIVRRDAGAVYRACYPRVPEAPCWPRRAIAAAASAVGDIAATARNGRFDRRAPRPIPG
jgi:hypothetical protein